MLYCPIVDRQNKCHKNNVDFYLCQYLSYIFIFSEARNSIPFITSIPFVWAYKPPRISEVHLRKPRAEGGLGLPIFHNYTTTGSVTLK